MATDFGQVQLQAALPIFRELQDLLPNPEVLEDILRQDFSTSLRGTLAAERESFERGGLGRSVAGAFSGGTRRLQHARALAKAIAESRAQRSGQNINLLQTAIGSPGTQAAVNQAFQDENKPSPLSQIFGTALGLGAKFGLPLLFPDPLTQLLQGQQGGGTSGPV